MASIYHHLPGFTEIDRDSPPDIGLDLPDTPIGLLRVAHQRPGFQNAVDAIHARKALLP